MEKKLKTQKFCPRCSKVKLVTEFHQNISALDGLQGWCKKCYQEYSLGTIGRYYHRLHKRPYPLDGKCELCGIKLTKWDYHHWDDSNPSLGLWVCCGCDFLAEGLDEIEKNPTKVNIYHGLKDEVEEVEKTHTPTIYHLSHNGIHKLFLNGQQTHKWCPRCGKMKQVKEFPIKHFMRDGLGGWCKECAYSYRIGSGNALCLGLHKRPKLTYCELCGDSEIKLGYHHWDNNNKSKGIWVCRRNKCHHLVEAVDKLNNCNLLPKKYSELKQRIIMIGGETNNRV